MQRCQTPVHAIQAQVLSQPVLQLILPLSLDERASLNHEIPANRIEGLNILDVFVDVQLQILWETDA